ncbi:MAG TPA: hypothetical protein VNJ04_05705 [Gemmatimonadaceae bacterium]|nr:hypothetical protein [Gemmatimonadaceae bacterium]
MANPPWSALRDVFARHTPRWWGNRFLIVVEAIALAALGLGYLYLRRGQGTGGITALPELRIPAANLMLMLVSLLPMWYAATIARYAGSARAIGAWLSLCAILGITFAVLRFFEMGSLRANHGTRGLASVGFAMLVVHLAHIAGATSSTVAITMQMLKGPVDEAHFGEVAANARYWYLMVCSWLAFYPIIYLAPRFL